MSFHWTQAEAERYLSALIRDTGALAKDLAFIEAHVAWQAKTTSFLEEVFGRSSRYFLSFTSFNWSFRGHTTVTIYDIQRHGHPDRVIAAKHQEAYRQQIQSARGLLTAALEELKRKKISDVYEGKDSGPESSQLVRNHISTNAPWWTRRKCGGGPSNRSLHLTAASVALVWMAW